MGHYDRNLCLPRKLFPPYVCKKEMAPCSGPCLPHCYRCSGVTAALARIAIVYMVACIVYLMVTRTYATPFADSLTDEQLEIRGESTRIRKHAFYMGVVIGILVVLNLDLRPS